MFTVELDGMQYISETMGTESANTILKQFAEAITGAAGRRRVFYVTGNRFAVVSESRKEDWRELVKSIRVRCEQPFYSDSVAITLTAPMCVTDYPEDALRLADIEALMEICLDDARMRSDEEVVYANIDLLEKHRRESRIIQINEAGACGASVRSVLSADFFCGKTAFYVRGGTGASTE